MPVMSPQALGRLWGMSPSLASPLDYGVPSCALWEYSPQLPVEMAGGPDPETHVISLAAAGRFSQEYFGDGRLRFRRRCAPGMINIVRAGEEPRAILTGETRRFSVFHIYMPHRMIADVAVSEGLVDDPAKVEVIDPQATADTAVERAANEIMTELNQSDPLSRLRIDILNRDLVLQVLRRHSNLASRAIPSRGGLAPWQLKRACEAMEAHLADDIGLAMLSEIAGCSPTHFSRAFKQSTGVPPSQWLLERRIERARTLLAEGDLSLAEVALAVGFAAQAQFTTAFKRVTGLTPGAWRRERR